MFNKVEHLINEMIENLGKIRQNRETNSSAVKEQKRIIEIKIHELGTKINTQVTGKFDEGIERSSKNK